MAVRYAHTFLFVCPACGLPIAISRVTKEQNSEDLGAELLRIKCSYCDKSSDIRALHAKKHYVEEWP